MTPRIFHYTSIESLALILRWRTIRFTRLDCVDDVREAQRHAGIDFGRYFFVSCWTLDDVESIPQWNMYSDRMRGVRLELPAYPFGRDQLRPPPQWSGINVQGNIESPLSFESLWGPTYFIAPMFLKPEHFAGSMNYVDDVESVYAHSIRRQVNPIDGTERLRIAELPLLPRFKSADWRFQKEYRFSLFVLPSLPPPPSGIGAPQFADRVGDHMSQSFLNNVDPGVDFIDVPLSPAALDELVVRTGPLLSPGMEVCVSALLSQLAPNARHERSSLSGTIRRR